MAPIAVTHAVFGNVTTENKENALPLLSTLVGKAETVDATKKRQN